MTPDAVPTQAFERERERLIAMAHRMLGSRADAEDAVQEAWLRLARQDAHTIDNLGGWLTTVVGRVCLDVLRSRQAKQEASYDAQLPEFVVTEDADDTPEESAVLADSVGVALLVVLETLRPDERLAFVLHDVFAVSFVEIGQILGKSTDAAKMLASRARRKVRGAPRSTAKRQEQREVVDAFLAAAREGDFEGLLKVLDPEVTWRSYTPRGTIEHLGAADVVEAAQRGRRAAVIARRVLVNGEPGILTWGRGGQPISVMACTVVEGRIADVVALVDPIRLATMDLPAPPHQI
ncbi:sigma-70 family RNA polymerase sigma factor [Ruania halotolerans]|uniref:sigma-70 family RNA polymerase sigma factor n=1 Tax=Ruania halotolerans TaxID=2897773 RepID=UPI001E300EDD|nr:sigma-70 family RNA polymerase sigma factor [Ruania halotolerans]UFU05535.1 sigma-70 family RNA polymerase sigma factor [Ruania halotolerans]